MFVSVMVLGLKACDQEAEQNEIKKTVNGCKMLKTVNPTLILMSNFK